MATGRPMPKTNASFNPDEYTTVAERIVRFYQSYPTGQIHTRLVSYQDGRVVVEASVYRCDTGARPATTGLASEHERDGEINAVACLENTETSAVGRALANLGFTGSARRPSREEMEKADRGRAALGRTAGFPARSAVNPRADLRRVAERASRITEPSAVEYEQLQHRADIHVQIAALLNRARRAGFPPARADVLEGELDNARGEEARLVPVATELRRWLREFSNGLAMNVDQAGPREAGATPPDSDLPGPAVGPGPVS